MDDVYLTAAAVVISAILSYEAYKLNSLTPDGAVASFAVGATVSILGSINAFFILTVFTVAGFGATMIGLGDKERAGLQEGRRGERTWKNVLGVGVAPVVAVVVGYSGLIDGDGFAVLFVATLAVAGADTIASEIGVRDRKTYMITTFKECEAGVNGGVSVLGTSVSTVAALLIAVLGWFVITETFSWLALIPFAMGVLGNVLDSVFGAVFENKGRMSKYVNNCSTELIASFVGLGIYLLV